MRHPAVPGQKLIFICLAAMYGAMQVQAWGRVCGWVGSGRRAGRSAEGGPKGPEEEKGRGFVLGGNGALRHRRAAADGRRFPQQVPFANLDSVDTRALAPLPRLPSPDLALSFSHLEPWKAWQGVVGGSLHLCVLAPRGNA